MSFRFPPDEYRLKFPPHNYQLALKSNIEIKPLLAKSRRRCTVHTDDGSGVLVLLGEMELPDNKQDIVDGIVRYCESTLDIDKIKLLVPEDYHSLMDDTLGEITQAHYRNDVCEILINWFI